jgi:hypothetical protein
MRSLVALEDVTADADAVPVVSGKRQELRVFRPGSTVFTQYLESGDREELPLRNGVAFTRPLAATFRGEDDSYFVLDDVGGGTLRLWRLDVTMAGTLLAEWTGVPTTHTFSLATTPDGDLLLQRGTSDGARAWRLEAGAGGSWSVTSAAQTTGNGVGTVAYPTSLGTVVFVPADERRAAEVALTAQTPASLSTLGGAL